MITEGLFKSDVGRRNQRGKLWRGFYQSSLIVAVIALLTLFLTVVDRAFGTIAVVDAIDPATLANGRPIDQLSGEELASILVDNLSVGRVRVLIRDQVIVNYNSDTLSQQTISELLQGKTYPPEVSSNKLSELTSEELKAVLAQNLSSGQLYDLVNAEIIKLDVVESWTLSQTLFNYNAIVAENNERHPDAVLQFHSWLNSRFLTSQTAQKPFETGLRAAIAGSIWIIMLTILFALPLGIAAAIYLEEYTHVDIQNRYLKIVNNIIETNIRNLAGVPSVIYGMLGLFVFVRSWGTITQGRTVLSASLTMALLILPVIIINAQEAIRAVPSSIREASYGLGATRWQTVWRQVLPAALPGILTGAILAVSRALGETAPLIVVGGVTQIFVDPNGPLSPFTSIPIQVYAWIPLPDEKYSYIAAAGIIVLLVLLLLLNAVAIILRNRFSRRLA